MKQSSTERSSGVRIGLGGRAPILVAVLLSAMVVASGCAGLMALAGYAAVAGTIKQLLDRPDAPTYSLSGYVYVDRAANKIAVQGDATLPGGGNFEPYKDASVTIDTSPPRTTTTTAIGFFEFKGLPTAQTTHILTIVTPDGSQVQFLVRLGQSTVTPL